MTSTEVLESADVRSEPPSGNPEPIVSTLMPAFNAERTIADALNSVLTQTFAAVEVIVVDDGSVDGTGRVVAEVAARFPGRVLYLKQNHMGPFAARNLAARRARGRYLALLDSDDVWLPDKLKRQVELMETRPNVVLCHTGSMLVDADGKLVESVPPDPSYTGRCFEQLLVWNRVPASSVVIRRDVFEQLGGFDEAFTARGDWEFWIRVSQVGDFAALNECLMLYRFHEKQISRDTDRMRKSHLAIIRKNETAYSDLQSLGERTREARFAAHLLYGTDYLLAGRRFEACCDFSLAILQKPYALRPWWLLAKALLPSRFLMFFRARRNAARRLSA